MEINALLCVRNELPYLKRVLPYLANEQIDVTLIDNDSTDGTLEALSSGEFPNVVHVEKIPYVGHFDLTRQLEVKAALSRNHSSGWLIHQDADEILHASSGWGGLRMHMEQADMQGFNVINFNELVMLPVDPEQDDIFINNKNYYFFEPRPLRLMRAWKRVANLDNWMTGGHVLQGEKINIYPQRMFLKHFIVRSQLHSYAKYLHRTFASSDLTKGWHGNRLNFTRDNLRIPTSGISLHRLANPKDVPAQLPVPVSTHFWEW